ncbi:MAG: SpoIIE family protein phosphatase, partial [Acidimicrobiia bacterium]
LSRWLSAIRDESRLYQPDDDDDTGFRITRPARVAAYLNDRFRASPGIAQYFTMVYGVLNVDTRRFTYTAAGHPGPIQIPQSGKPVVHESTGAV